MNVVRVFKGLFALSAVFAASALLTPNVQAAPITSIGGVYGSVTPQGVSTSTVNFTVGLVTQVNGSSVFGTASSLAMNLAGWTSNPGSVSFTPSTMTVTNGSNSATFALTNASLQVVGGAGIIDAVVSLISSSGSWDLSQFAANGGMFAMTLQSIASARSGAITLDPSATASFTFSANQFPPPAVPEPASLLMWGTLGMAGMWYGRRRQQRKLAV